ncbi:MAG TPA: SDR family oxidoreductase [Balneolaceae bacterium]|nr:SDR family oxidoreductase [Balneolaceae bacterium]
MKTLRDKVILITGGGQGLGKATARVLVKDGAKVILGDINDDQAKLTVSEIRQNGEQIENIHLDVGDQKSVENTFEDIYERYGSIDVLINNAGVDVTKSVTDLSFDEWDKVLKVNLYGSFNTTKKFFELAGDQGGHIVNISSTAAKGAWENAAAYHASKWGLLGFSHAMHVEGRPKNIKVTALIAGGMKTPFIMERFPEAEPNLQDPKNVAETIRYTLLQPDETVIPEVMVIPMKETSWP